MATTNRNQGGQSKSKRSNSGSSANKSSGVGRGWHGDSAGHAAAGAQSHKNDKR